MGMFGDGKQLSSQGITLAIIGGTMLLVSKMKSLMPGGVATPAAKGFKVAGTILLAVGLLLTFLGPQVTKKNDDLSMRQGPGTLDPRPAGAGPDQASWVGPAPTWYQTGPVPASLTAPDQGPRMVRIKGEGQFTFEGAIPAPPGAFAVERGAEKVAINPT